MAITTRWRAPVRSPERPVRKRWTLLTVVLVLAGIAAVSIDPSLVGWQPPQHDALTPREAREILLSADSTETQRLAACKVAWRDVETAIQVLGRAARENPEIRDTLRQWFGTVPGRFDVEINK